MSEHSESKIARVEDLNESESDDIISIHPTREDLAFNSHIDATMSNAGGNDDDANMTLINIDVGKYVRPNNTTISSTEMMANSSMITRTITNTSGIFSSVLGNSTTTTSLSNAVASNSAACMTKGAIQRQFESISSSRQASNATIPIRTDPRTVYMAGLARQLKNSESDEFASLPKFALETQRQVAETYWGKFMDAHKVAFDNVRNDDDMGECVELQFQVESMYIELISRLRQRIEMLTQNETPFRINRNEHNGRNRHEDMGIAKMEMNKFGGGYKEWRSFKSMSETYFHNNRELPDHTKMFRLINCLKPGSEACNLIAQMDVRGENYATAWATLVDFYDDSRKILDEIISEFLDIPRITNPSREALVNLKIKTQNMIESMPKYDVNTIDWGVWLVPVVVRKLDYKSLSLWATQRPKKVKPHIEPLIEFITTRSESIDDEIRAKREQNTRWREQTFNRNAGQPNAKNNSSNAPAANTSNQAAGNASNNESNQKMSNAERKQKCPDPLCKANNFHPLHKCFRFKALDLEGRKQKVTSLGVCALCLRKECEPSKCHMSPCRNCDECHNSYLCPAHVIEPVKPPKSFNPSANVAVMVPPNGASVDD